MKLGELIEKGMKDVNISEERLAEKMGCTTNAIQSWINGRVGITLANADKLFKVLELRVTIGRKTEKKVVKKSKGSRKNGGHNK